MSRLIRPPPSPHASGPTRAAVPVRRLRARAQRRHPPSGVQRSGRLQPSNEGASRLAACGSASRSRSRGWPDACRASRARGRRNDDSRASCSRPSIADAVGVLAARLPRGSALVSATNGKTTTAAMVAEILGARRPARPQPCGREPRLRRRVGPRSRRHDAELGLFEVDEAAFPEIARRVRPARGRPREPLPRPARPLRRARARRRALARLRSRRSPARDPSSRTPTIRCSRTSCAGAQSALRFGLDDPSVARDRLPHAADSKYCVRLRDAVRVRGGVRRPPRRLPLPARRRRAAARSTSRARSIVLDGLERRSSTSSPRQGDARVSLGAPGPLQRLQRARGRVARPDARRDARRGRRRSRSLPRRVRALRADPRRRPRRCSCSSSRTRRARTRRCGRSWTAAPPRVAVIALNDEIADGRDVSWIWDVDFEPLAAGARPPRRDRLARAGAGAAVQVRRARAGPDRGRARRSSRRSTAGSS